MPGEENKRGSTIKFMTHSQSINKWGGDDIDGAIMDEHAPKKYLLENISRTTDRNGFIILTQTPEYGTTWEDDFIREQRARGAVAVFEFDLRNNPHISEEGIIEAIEAVRHDPNLFRRVIQGHRVALGGLVFPNFSLEHHIIDDPDELPPDNQGIKAVGVDGHMKKPWAVGWYWWSPEGDCLKYREGEWDPATGGGIQGFYNWFQVRNAGDKPQLWIADEAMGSQGKGETLNAMGMTSMLQQLNDLGLPFVPTNRIIKKDVMDRIMKTRALLATNPATGRPRYRMTRSCVQTAIQYAQYQFRPESNEGEADYKEKILKIKDDQIDVDGYIHLAEPAWNLPKQMSGVSWDEYGQPVIDMYRGQNPYDLS